MIISSLNVLCLEFQLEEKQKNLSVRVFNISYKDKFINKTVFDGLPHLIMFSGELYEKSKLLAKKESSHYFYFDLWDEVFNVRTEDKSYKRKKKGFIKRIQNRRFIDLIAVKKLSSAKDYRFVFKTIVDPIGKEKIQKMAVYKNEQLLVNRVQGLTPSETGTSVNTQSAFNNIVLKSGPRFNNIFNKILREYSKGKKDSALWSYQEEFNFKLKEVLK